MFPYNFTSELKEERGADSFEIIVREEGGRQMILREEVG